MAERTCSAGRSGRVHLVRDGRTAPNRERRTMGWLEERIVRGWMRTAAAVADALAREPVDSLASSPLVRAMQVAVDLADGRIAVEFIHDAVVRAAVAWALGTGPEIYGTSRCPTSRSRLSAWSPGNAGWCARTR